MDLRKKKLKFYSSLISTTLTTLVLNSSHVKQRCTHQTSVTLVLSTQLISCQAALYSSNLRKTQVFLFSQVHLFFFLTVLYCTHTQFIVIRRGPVQKLHTTPPENLTDDELLLRTFCAEDLVRKHSGGWDNDHVKCLSRTTPNHTGSGLLQSSIT